MKIKIKLKDVKNSYNIKKMEGFPLVAKYFGRPLGDYFAVVFYNLGFSANQVTIFRFLLSIVGYCLLFFDTYFIILLGVLFLLFAFILDFVDGHIARLKNLATYWGKYIDGIVDYVFPAFISLPISLRFFFEEQNHYFISISLFCIFVVLLNRVSRDRSRYFLLTLSSKAKVLNEKNKLLISCRKKENFWALSSANTRIICLFILFIPNSEFVFLISILITQFICETFWLYYIFKCSYFNLNHWKKSASAK